MIPSFRHPIFAFLSYAFILSIPIIFSRTTIEISRYDLYSDLLTYQYWYQSAPAFSYREYVSNLRYEVMYTTTTWLLQNIGLPFDGFVLLIKCLLSAAYFRFSLKITGSLFLSSLSTLAFVLSPIYYSYTENILRQGLAFALFLIGLQFLVQGRTWWFLFLSSATFLFHYSSVVWSIIAYISILSVFNRRIRIIISIYFVFLIVYTLNIPLVISPGIANFAMAIGISYTQYFGGEAGGGRYVIGFKILFLLASTILLLGFLLTVAFKRFDHIDKFLLLLCTLLTVTYVLASSFPFYDRVATIGWSFTPIVWAGILRRRYQRQAVAATRS